MSVHYSKCQLNTFSGTDYFRAHAPEDYPINLICQKVRRFRALPPNVQRLAALAKAWWARTHPGDTSGAEGLYDAAGYELDPATGARLTDDEVAAMWSWPAPDVEVADIPVPAGGFPDPNTWEPPAVADDDDDAEDDGPTEAQLVNDIAGFGRARVARDYGVPVEQLARIGSDRELAQLILRKRG